MRLNKRWAVPVVAGLLLVLGTATPAAAEGWWSSYFSNWSTGANSRTWADNNTDNHSTGVFVSACTYNWPGGNRIGLRLRRSDTWTPDEDYGSKNYACTSGSGQLWQLWGNKGAGTFYFNLYSINDSTTGWGWAKVWAKTAGASY
jgi:hypothetical protein